MCVSVCPLLRGRSLRRLRLGRVQLAKSDRLYSMPAGEINNKVHVRIPSLSRLVKACDCAFRELVFGRNDIAFEKIRSPRSHGLFFRDRNR